MSLDCLAPPNATRDWTEPHQHSGMCACTFQYSASDTDYCIHRRAYALQQKQPNDDQPATNTGNKGNDQRISGFSDRRGLASPVRNITSKNTNYKRYLEPEPAKQRRRNQTVPATREDDYKLYREVKLQNQPSRPSYSGTLRSRDDPQHHSSNRDKFEKIFKVEKNITK